MNLFKLELKRIMKNGVFYITSILMVLFLVSQFPPDFSLKDISNESNLIKSQIKVDDFNLIKNNAIVDLYNSNKTNNFITYPFGIFKRIKINEEKRLEINKIISSLTNIKLDALIREDEVSNLKVKEKISEDEFYKAMDYVGVLIGRGSVYEQKNIKNNFSKINITEPLKEGILKDIKEIDKITGAYGRLFCDYFSIAIVFLPLFLVISFFLEDKKNIYQNIFIREVKSKDIVLFRALAIFIAYSLIILISALFYTIVSIKVFGGFNIDKLAFIKYSIAWLIPELMLVIAFSVFLSILFNSLLALVINLFTVVILIQGTKADNYINKDGIFTLLIRHNSFGETRNFIDNLNYFSINRSIMIIIAIILTVISIFLLNYRRRGELPIGD